MKYLETFHFWHQSGVSDRLSGDWREATTRAPVPGNHLPGNRVPMADARSFWSSNRVFVSKAYLPFPLWLISIPSSSVCLSEIIDHCSTTLEWQRGRVTLKRKRQTTKSTMDFVEKKKKLINLSFSLCLKSCFKKWSFDSWTIPP